MCAVCMAKSNRRSALFWTTLSFFFGFAGVAAFGPIIPVIKNSMPGNAVLMGLLAASPALTGSLLRIPFGAMADRVGGKRPIAILLVLSALGLASSTILFWLFPVPDSSHSILLLISGFLCSCGVAVFSVGIPTVSYWYPQAKQGAALALYAGLGNMAPGIFAFIFPVLANYLGFATAYLIWLLIFSILITVIALFMKDAPYFQYREMGIEIDSQALFHECGQELIPSGNVVANLIQAASDIRTWTLTFLYFVTFGGFIALSVWLPTFFTDNYGVNLVTAGAFTSLYAFSSSCLRVAGGYVSDRWGGRKVLLGALTVTAVGASLMMLSYDSLNLALAGIMLLALGMGLANAAVFKLLPKFMPNAVGGAAGIVGGLGALGGFVIPILMGAIVDSIGKHGYPLGFGVFVFLSLSGLILFKIISRSMNDLGSGQLKD